MENQITILKLFHDAALRPYWLIGFNSILKLSQPQTRAISVVSLLVKTILQSTG